MTTERPHPQSQESLPSKWSQRSLRSVCLSDGEYGANVPKRQFDPVLPRYIRITDISSEGTLLNDEPASISEENAADYLLNDGDILLARSGATVGKSYMHVSTNERCAFAGYLIRFRPNRTEVVPEYLRQFFQSSKYWLWVRDTQRALAQPNINATEYGSLPVPVPPLPEQRKIAAILSSVDDTIEKTKSVIDQLGIVQKGLIDELLTQGMPGRYKDHKKTEIGNIPISWRICQLKEIAEVRTGLAKNSKRVSARTVELPYLRVANVQDGYLDLREIKTIKVGIDLIERYLLRDGDVLFNEGGDADKVGRGTVWRGQLPQCLHQNHVFSVRPSADILPEFLSFHGGSTRGKAYFLDAAKQTTNLASINSSQLKALPVPLPPLDEQREIVEIVDSLRVRRETEEKLLNAMHHMKKALLDSLLSGKTRVSTSDQEAA